jgi:hypothetical protein
VPKSKGRRKPAPHRPAQQRAPRPVLPAPTAPGLRGGVERRSAPALLWLSSRPKLLLPVLSLVLLIGGLAAPLPVAVPLLLVLLAVVGWLTYLSWPAVVGRGPGGAGGDRRPGRPGRRPAPDVAVTPGLPVRRSGSAPP